MSELDDKINALGSDTIMGQLGAISNDETDAQLQNLQEASDSAIATTNAAVTGTMPMGYYRKTRPIVRDYKIGRNDKCPCGSGKKYKNCCLASGKYETTHEA